MIRERPGEPNDREKVISNIDNDKRDRDLPRYRENFDKINWNSSKSLQKGMTKVDK